MRAEQITVTKMVMVIFNKRPLGCFYAFDGRKIIGRDNSTGCAMVEEFDRFEECENWLQVECACEA